MGSRPHRAQLSDLSLHTDYPGIHILIQEVWEGLAIVSNKLPGDADAADTWNNLNRRALGRRRVHQWEQDVEFERSGDKNKKCVD